MPNLIVPVGSSVRVQYTGGGTSVYSPARTVATSSTSTIESFFIDCGNGWSTLPIMSGTTGAYFGAGGSSTSITVSSANNCQTYWYYEGIGGGSFVSVDHERAKKEYARKRSAQVQVAKQAIKRALKLMDNVGFGNDARVFLGGNSVEVSHPESIFKFVLSKRQANLIERTINPGHSTPYYLELYTKTDVHVANLCVYMEQTPILDQVLALTMFIRSGDENHLLETANWSKVVSDPQLVEAICLHAPSLERKVRRLNYHH